MAVTTIRADTREGLQQAKDLIYDQKVFFAFLDDSEASARVRGTLTSPDMARYFHERKINLALVYGAPNESCGLLQSYKHQDPLTYSLFRASVFIGNHPTPAELDALTFRQGIDSLINPPKDPKSLI
ncbi:MAG: hypothetical protein ABIH82_01340 [Candidatus Woesearchaeota archaeon]